MLEDTFTRKDSSLYRGATGMIEKFFAPFNAYLISHPTLLAKLKLLFWIKYWALMLLMAFFVYLLYREQSNRRLANSTERLRRRCLFEA